MSLGKVLVPQGRLFKDCRGSRASSAAAQEEGRRAPSLPSRHNILCGRVTPESGGDIFGGDTVKLPKFQKLQKTPVMIYDIIIQVFQL